MAVNASTLLPSSSGSGTARLLDRRVYTSNGTWTKPADGAGNIASGIGKIVRIWLIGGGGAGSYLYQNVATGGGGGGLTDKYIDIIDCGATVSVTIGAGGTSSGQNGGDTLFGTSLGRAGGGRGPQSHYVGGPGGGGTYAGGDGGGWTLNNYNSQYSPLNGGSGGGAGGGAGLGNSSSALGGGGFGIAGVDYGPGAGADSGGNGNLYGGGGSVNASTTNATPGAAGVAVIEVWG